MEFNAAFSECKDQFDVIVNCVSAKVNFSGMMGMLAHDGVAVQVRSAGQRGVPSLAFLFLRGGSCPSGDHLESAGT